MSLRDRLVCFADFFGINLLACLLPMAPFLFLLPLPNCFLKVCLPTLFAAVLNFFLPLTTSAISGTANSNKSALTRFAAGTIYLRKNGTEFLPIIPVHVVDQHLYRMETLLLLKQSPCNVF